MIAGTIGIGERASASHSPTNSFQKAPMAARSSCAGSALEPSENLPAWPESTMPRTPLPGADSTLRAGTTSSGQGVDRRPRQAQFVDAVVRDGFEQVMEDLGCGWRHFVFNHLYGFGNADKGAAGLKVASSQDAASEARARHRSCVEGHLCPIPCCEVLECLGITALHEKLGLHAQCVCRGWVKASPVTGFVEKRQ